MFYNRIRKGVEDMKKFTVFLSTLIILSMFLVGCSSGGGEVSQGKDVELTYYVIASGPTSFYLMPMKKTVHFTHTPTVGEKLKVALSLLASSTLETSTTMVPLPHDTRVLGVSVSGDEATVNFSKEIMKNPGVGAEGEALALCSIPMVAEQFGIKKVYVKINGELPSESNGYIDFWGHIGLYEQPLTATGCKDTP